jgi:hypothetical protein
MSLLSTNKLYYHHFDIYNENKCTMYKYKNLNQLANLLKTRFKPGFTVKELSTFKTNHFTLFNDRVIFGKNRYELEKLFYALFSDRQPDDEDEVEY